MDRRSPDSRLNAHRVPAPKSGANVANGRRAQRIGPPVAKNTFEEGRGCIFSGQLILGYPLEIRAIAHFSTDGEPQPIHHELSRKDIHKSTMFTKREKKEQKERETATARVRIYDEAKNPYGKILT